MDTLKRKHLIEETLKTFGSVPLKEAATAVFECLGYRSQKQLDLEPKTGAGFISTFAQDRPFNREQAMVDDWQSVDFLFQLTDAEIQTSGQGQLPHPAHLLLVSSRKGTSSPPTFSPSC